MNRTINIVSILLLVATGALVWHHALPHVHSAVRDLSDVLAELRGSQLDVAATLPQPPSSAAGGGAKPLSSGAIAAGLASALRTQAEQAALKRADEEDEARAAGVPVVFEKLGSMQRLGQLFSVDLRALITAPTSDDEVSTPGEVLGPSRFVLDQSAIDLAFGLFCIGSVFVTSLDVKFPAQPAFTLTSAELTDAFTRLTDIAATKCPSSPLFVWMPDYHEATTASPTATLGASAHLPSAFMRWPFLPASADLERSSLTGYAAAASFEPARMQRLARAIARDARRIGFHVLGSVPLHRTRRSANGLLDVGGDVTHSFGDEVELVSEFASAVISGLQNQTAYGLFPRTPELPTGFDDFVFGAVSSHLKQLREMQRQALQRQNRRRRGPTPSPSSTPTPEEDSEEIMEAIMTPPPPPPTGYAPLEVPSHEWSDLFTSPWLPPTLNVLPVGGAATSDDDDEPSEDAGLDALTHEPAPAAFVRSGSWGRMRFGARSVAAAAPLFAHATSPGSQAPHSMVWSAFSSSPSFYSDAFLASEIYPTFRRATAAGVSMLFVPRTSSTTAALLPSHKYLQDALRGAQLRFGGLIVAAASDLDALHSRLRMSATSSEALIDVLASAIDICFMGTSLDASLLRRAHDIMTVAEQHAPSPTAPPEAVAVTKSPKLPSNVLNQPDDALRTMLRHHHLNASHIHAKVKKVLGLKRAFGFFDYTLISPTAVPTVPSPSRATPTISTNQTAAPTSAAPTPVVKPEETLRELLAAARDDGLIMLRNVNGTLPLPLCLRSSSLSCVPSIATDIHSEASHQRNGRSSGASTYDGRTLDRIAIIEFVPHSSAIESVRIAANLEWSSSYIRRYTVWISHKLVHESKTTLGGALESRMFYKDFIVELGNLLVRLERERVQLVLHVLNVPFLASTSWAAASIENSIAQSLLMFNHQPYRSVLLIVNAPSTQLFPAAARQAADAASVAAGDFSGFSVPSAGTQPPSDDSTDLLRRPGGGLHQSSAALAPTADEEATTLQQSRLWWPSSRLITVPDAVLLTFSDDIDSIRVALRALDGRFNPRGRLPFVFFSAHTQSVLAASLSAANALVSSAASEIIRRRRTEMRRTGEGALPTDSDSIAPALPVGFGLSYTRFSLRSMRVHVASASVVEDAFSATSQPVPHLNISIEVHHVSGPPGTAVVLFYVWPLHRSPLPPDPSRLRSFVRTVTLSSEQHVQRVRVLIPASQFLHADEYGHPRLSNGTLRLFGSLRPLESVTTWSMLHDEGQVDAATGLYTSTAAAAAPSAHEVFDPFGTLTGAAAGELDTGSVATRRAWLAQDMIATWTAKLPRRFAPCVYFSTRKRREIHRVLSWFFVLSTVFGALIGAFCLFCVYRCREASAAVEAKYNLVQMKAFDPIERAKRADAARAAKAAKLKVSPSPANKAIGPLAPTSIQFTKRAEQVAPQLDAVDEELLDGELMPTEVNGQPVRHANESGSEYSDADDESGSDEEQQRQGEFVTVPIHSNPQTASVRH